MEHPFKFQDVAVKIINYQQSVLRTPKEYLYTQKELYLPCLTSTAYSQNNNNLQYEFGCPLKLSLTSATFAPIHLSRIPNIYNILQ